jgi:hypothetical protein
MPIPTTSTPEIVAAVIFALAVAHTFSTKFFAHLAHRQPRHAGLWHLLAEVEVVFGFWAFVLVASLFCFRARTLQCIPRGAQLHRADVRVRDDGDCRQPPDRQHGDGVVRLLASMIPIPARWRPYFLCMSVVPLLGSFITEPAAMTLAALMLRDGYFRREMSSRLKYATIGMLFVNVSIGGTLTNFAAPPVLMVAAKWQWDSLFMLSHFGWKAAAAVFFNAPS